MDKDCLTYVDSRVREVLLFWEAQPITPDSPAKDRAEAYRDSLAGWREKNEAHVKLWLEVEWASFAMCNPRAEQFLIEQHMPDTKGNARNNMLLRRAIIYSLKGVERFTGELSFIMMEASQFLLAIGFIRADNIPEDLEERVEKVRERLEGMDEDELALAYCGGAHWIIHEFRTPESMVEPLKAIGYALEFQPVIRRLEP